MGLFSYSKEKEIKLKIKQIIYYFVIGFISVVAVVILPLLNSHAEVKFDFPTTPAGWLVYIITRASIALINILFYFCFMAQAKINVKHDEKYLKACEILEKIDLSNERKPKSPKAWTAKQYTSKTITLTLTSVLSVIGLTNAILAFDLAVFLAYFLTVCMGLVFGFIQMKKAEDYWTDEFFEYAIMVQKQAEKSDICDCTYCIRTNNENAGKTAIIDAKEENNDSN